MSLYTPNCLLATKSTFTMSTHNQIAAVGLSLLRRSLESDPNTPDTPQGSTVTFRPLTWGLILLVTIIFAPAYFFVSLPSEKRRTAAMVQVWC